MRFKSGAIIKLLTSKIFLAHSLYKIHVKLLPTGTRFHSMMDLALYTLSLALATHNKNYQFNRVI